MERYIKPLYIASIIAIISFLAMQVYWLYGRYEYSVREYENRMLPRISELIDQYNTMRSVMAEKPGGNHRYVSSYNMDKKVDDRGVTVRTIKIQARKFEPWRLLGYTSPKTLTEAEILRASQLALLDNSNVDSLIITAEIDASHSESAVWGAADAVSLDFNHPFSSSDFDSLLTENQIDADISLIKSNHMLWKPEIKRHESITNPKVSYTIPYSILENKNVVVTIAIPVRDILGGLIWTLTVAFVVSLLLIACLIFQFRIIFRLNRIDKMRNNFITTMIHELKRPVSTLKMSVSGLRNTKMIENVEIREELLGDTKEALDLLSAYFSKMRDITFNDRTQIPLSCGIIDLRSLAEDTAKRIPVPSGKTVDFRIDVEPGMTIYADKTHISNVLLNLFENAVKYSGDHVSISVSSQMEESGNVRISIKDNGNGISSSDIERVFSRFYRGKASYTDIPGMGLGLTYVKLLVEAHGGTVTVSSHTDGADKGTCFTIELPQ